jgi:hypothetical protein
VTCPKRLLFNLVTGPVAYNMPYPRGVAVPSQSGRRGCQVAQSPTKPLRKLIPSHVTGFKWKALVPD